MVFGNIMVAKFLLKVKVLVSHRVIKYSALPIVGEFLKYGIFFSALEPGKSQVNQAVPNCSLTSQVSGP